MGTDSYIFDEVSKECLYFDRKHHFFTYGPHEAKLEDIFRRMDATFKTGERATSEEVVYACEANINNKLDGCHNEGHQESWNTAIREFAAARPNGRFFSASDHDFYLSWEIRDEEFYTEIGEH